MPQPTEITTANNVTRTSIKASKLNVTFPFKLQLLVLVFLFNRSHKLSSALSINQTKTTDLKTERRGIWTWRTKRLSFISIVLSTSKPENAKFKINFNSIKKSHYCKVSSWLVFKFLSSAVLRNQPQKNCEVVSPALFGQDCHIVWWLTNQPSHTETKGSTNLAQKLCKDFSFSQYNLIHATGTPFLKSSLISPTLSLQIQSFPKYFSQNPRCLLLLPSMLRVQHIRTACQVTLD
jgi:hypothetical protein